eukprot:gnl/TRDRNA2_/TRDRNA2_169123_c1_seq2.p3 gnl/TRDRNA2_/TRDRNA2_169123_c1~~gnl/TRDRNA2_/TRDRNA2_169123_c1_seq2.p3  ORF type:complete len:123 (+),score=21.98 gnl/TRDRNA2_/TRDRNA2_169123_c1_seq2:77-445(+)
MLVPSGAVGSVIGKQASTLKHIREQSGVSVQVERDDILGERLVTASGPLMQVQAAASLVVSYLDGASSGSNGTGQAPPLEQSPLPTTSMAGIAINPSYSYQPTYQPAGNGYAGYMQQLHPMF